MKLLICVKDPASRRAPVGMTELEVPGQPGNLRALIRAVAAACAADFNRRGEASGPLDCLTRGELEGMARSGKISFGERHNPAPADPERAADTAVACFADGLFRVFLGEEELEDLDGPVDLASGRALTFVKLTMLAGRMW